LSLVLRYILPLSMKWQEIFWRALGSVRSNLLRSVLTIFIIAFGIMALVGILTAIDAAIFSLNDNFSRVGANSFSVRPLRETVRRAGGKEMTKRAEVIKFEQAIRFKEEFEFPATVAISVRGTSFATAKFASEETNPNVRVEGVDEFYLTNNGFSLELGRNISPADVLSGANRAIIGKDIVKNLFGDDSPKALDQLINIDNIKYKIIGILESKGSSFGSSEDNTILIPLSTAKKYYGDPNDYYKISVAVRSAEEIGAAEAVATGVMRRVRRLKVSEQNDFEFVKSDSLIGIIKDNTSMLRFSAIAIGLITLLGAAIGLMNIMLVTVTERTKEIGINKALGATSKNVLWQFLTEAVLICQVGGVVGILLGIMIGNLVTLALGGSFLIPWFWMFVGIVLCVIVGVMSGMYPAMKAAAMDPIESLRYE